MPVQAMTWRKWAHVAEVIVLLVLVVLALCGVIPAWVVTGGLSWDAAATLFVGLGVLLWGIDRLSKRIAEGGS